MSDRCTRSNANAAWTCVLPEGHEGDHIYTLWSEIAIHAEAAIQRVRELHHPIPGFNGTQWCGAHCEATADGDPTEYPCETIRALDGGAE